MKNAKMKNETEYVPSAFHFSFFIFHYKTQ